MSGTIDESKGTVADQIGLRIEKPKFFLTYGRLGKGMVSFFSDGTPICTVEEDNLDSLRLKTEETIQDIQLRGRVNLLTVLNPMPSGEGEIFELNYSAYRRVSLYAVYQGFELTLKQQKAANILGVKAAVIQTWVRSGYFETFPYPSTGAKVIYLSSFLSVVPEKYHEESISLARVLRKEMGAQELNRIKNEIGWRDVGERHPIEEKFDPKLRNGTTAAVAPNPVVDETKYKAEIFNKPRGLKLAEQRERTWHHGSWAMMGARSGDLDVINRRLKAPPEARIFNLNGEKVDRFTMQNYLVLVVSSGALLAEVASGAEGMPTMLEVHRWMQDDVNFADAMEDAEKIQAHVFADMGLSAVMDGDKDSANLHRYQHDALLLRAGMQDDRFREKRISEVVDKAQQSKEELIQQAFRLLKAKPDVLATIVKEAPALANKVATEPQEEEEDVFYPEPSDPD